jgi:hypothetical protein
MTAASSTMRLFALAGMEGSSGGRFQDLVHQYLLLLLLLLSCNSVVLASLTEGEALMYIL